MFRKNSFPFTPATTATSGVSLSFTWKLLLIGFLVITGFVGSISGGLTTHTAKAAPKPHASTIQVTDCSNFNGANTLGNALTIYSSGDTIQFACSGGTSGVYTITVPSTINVAQDLTLDGNGYNVTLDGGSAVELLYVITGTNFTLNGLTIANGKAPANNCVNNGSCGGGIYDFGILTITNSTFYSNTAVAGGGAIYITNTGTINNLSNSTFYSNTASGPASGGGAIYIDTGGSVNNLTNSTFYSNTAFFGGAIFNYLGSINNLTNSTFYSNTARIDGGAIANENILNNLTNNTFVSNASNIGGAASFTGYGYVTNISGNTFISNSSNVDGGALQLLGNLVVTLTDNTFANNTSGQTGGAIFMGANVQVTLTNSTFYSNTAKNAGALYNYSDVNSTSIVNSTFVSNTAATYAGAIYNNSTVIYITNSTFVSNTAASGGGTIFNLNSSGVGGLGNTSIANSILAAGASGANCYNYNSNGTIIDNGSNLSDDSSCPFSGSSSNNVTNLNLGTLGNYGGATQTIPITSNSAAFREASSNCPTTDQRGITRPATNCSAGAFEAYYSIVTLNSTPNPSYYGQPVTFTAAISPTNATGTLTFTIGSSSVVYNNIVGGNPISYVTTTLPAGNNIVTATYSGDATHPSNSASVTQTVTPLPTTLSLASSANPSGINQSVVFTATVNGTGPTLPSGTVTFTNATTNQPLGTATVANGVASIMATFAITGTYSITANYGGDNNYTGSNTSLSQRVATLPPTIAANAGNGQSTSISTTFPVNLAAIVRDGNTGQPISGAVVIFQAPSSGASGFFSPTNSTAFTATTDANGIAIASAFVANGTVGSYQVTATTSGAASPAVFNLVNSPAGTASGYSYYLPFLANNASNFTTYLVFQNTANVTSTVTISFFDNNGNAVSAASGTCISVAALGECIVPNPFANGKQGQGIIVSQQPLNVIVSEATPFGGSAYAVTAGASNNLIAPVAIKGGLVDFTTQLSIFNGGNASVAGTVQFFDQNGNHVTAADKSFTLAAHSTTIYDQSQDNTLANFYGWVQITSPAGSQLVAQTVEQRPSVKFVAIVNAQFNPQTTLYAPAIFNGAFGNFVTGANLVNPNSQPVTVSITYYKNDGTASTTAPFTIGADGVAGIFQGGTSGNGLPNGGLPSNWYGAATVKVTGGSGIIMFVNEQGGLTATGSDQSGTYGAAVSGSSTVGLPVMANGAFGGYITGATIENITSSPVTATVQYYDLNGNTVGTAKTVTIGGNASVALYQGGSDQALPNGFYGTAQITVTGGPSSSLLVTTNAQSNAFFYSYTEPNF